MKKRILFSMLGATLLSVSILVGCGSQQTTSEEVVVDDVSTQEADVVEEVGEEVEDKTDLKGNILLAGSTSMEKLANAVSEAFMAKYPNTMVRAEIGRASCRERVCQCV